MLIVWGWCWCFSTGWAPHPWVRPAVVLTSLSRGRASPAPQPPCTHGEVVQGNAVVTQGRGGLCWVILRDTSAVTLSAPGLLERTWDWTMHFYLGRPKAGWFTGQNVLIFTCCNDLFCWWAFPHQPKKRYKSPYPKRLCICQASWRPGALHAPLARQQHEGIPALNPSSC